MPYSDHNSSRDDGNPDNGSPDGGETPPEGTRSLQPYRGGDIRRREIEPLSHQPEWLRRPANWLTTLLSAPLQRLKDWALGWSVRRRLEQELEVLDARRQYARARQAAEEAEWDLEIRQTMHRGGLYLERALLQHELETERLRLEIAQMRARRLQFQPASNIETRGSFGSPGSFGNYGRGAQSPFASPLSWDLSDREIEQLALQAWQRFGQLPADEAEGCIAAWDGEVDARFPEHVASELKARVRELRDLSR